MRVLVFGDSVTQGFWDIEGGWANRVRKYFDQQKISNQVDDPPTVFNLGISGDTTKAVLERFDCETQARKLSGEEFVLVFAIGANDTVYRGEENELEPGEYIDLLGELVRKARQYSSKILFVGLTPVIDALLQPMPWSSSGKCYSTRRMRLFDDALVEFCDKNKLLLASVFSDFEKGDLRKLTFDGIHPNDEGHKLIYEIVKPKLEELLK